MRSRQGGPGFMLAPTVLLLLGCPGSAGPGPAPTLESLEPRIAAPNVPMHLVITGRGFGGAALTQERAPTLTIVRTHDLDGHAVTGPSDSGLVPVIVSTPGGVERVEIDVVVTDAAPPGLYTFRLTRRDGASGDFPDALALVPPLGPTALDAGAVCIAAPSPAVGISGTAFLVVDGVGPTVALTDGLPWWVEFRAALPAVPSGCRQVPFQRADLRLCTRLEAPLPAAPPLRVYAVVVAQPPPADRLAAVSLPLLVDGPLGSITLSQARSALDAPVDLVAGSFSRSPQGIHVPTGAAPSAVVDGVALAVATSGCQSALVPGEDWCSTVTMTVPQGFPPGAHTIALTTMPGCTGEVSFTLTPRPSVAGVAPQIVCLRGNTPLQVTGSGFLDPHVFLDGWDLPLGLTCPPDGSICDRITAYLGAFPEPPGSYDLAVANGSLPPALSTEIVPVTVAPGPPTAMILSPQTIYGGASRPVFVGFTEPATTITSVALTPWYTHWGGGGPLTPVPYVQSAQGVDITVPAGTPPDWYYVMVTEGGLCTGGVGWPVIVASDYRVLSNEFTDGLGQPTRLEIEWKDLKPATDPVVLPQWQASGGNPGGAVSYAFAAGDPTWYFAFSRLFGFDWAGFDMSALHFDLLLASSGGAPVGGHDVRLRGNQSELRFSLPAPPGPAWRSYVVPLDDPAGWTFVDAGGSRPATVADLQQGIAATYAVWIRGLYADGGGETWLDNLLVELHH